jgi:branched-chain amino acid transport system ATP-binding protein/branched-chain amino acid transport system permease protein
MSSASVKRSMKVSAPSQRPDQATEASDAAVGEALSPGWRKRIRPTTYAIVVLGVLLVLFGIRSTRQDYLLQGSIAISFAIAATGLGVAMGLGGEFFLGQLAVFAVGAYVTVVLTVDHGWTFWLAALAGIAGATAVGLGLSLIGLRVSRYYFSLIGFFLIFLIPNVVQAFTAETGGTAGLNVTDLPSLFGTQLDNRGIFLLATAALLVVLLLVDNIRRAPVGMHLRWLRDSPIVLASYGVPPWRVRISMYAISSVLAGVAGAIYSHISGYIGANDFDLTTSILLFAAVLIGGSTSLLGPSIGVIILYVIPNVVVPVSSYSDFIYGAIIVLSVLVFRGGVERTVIDATRRVKSCLRGQTTKQPASAERSTATRVSDLRDMLWELRSSVSSREGLLAIRGGRKRFGGVAAIDMDDDSELGVRTGEVHVLLGPNGSGKTSLVNAMSGLVQLDGGSVKLGERDLRGTPVARIAKLGISRSFQSPLLPNEATPRELLVASLNKLEGVSYFHWVLSDPWARAANRRSQAFADRLLNASGLGAAADEPCRALTSGQRRILGVLLALVSRAMIVLLDEPAAGLSAGERTWLGDLIMGLADKGLGFLVVEHDLDFAFRIASCVTVLSNGRQVVQGAPDEVRDNRLARDVLIGGGT